MPYEPAQSPGNAGGSGLAEPQGHAIGFADRQEGVATHFLATQRRRQRPDPVGMILRVLRVGIDLAAGFEDEAGGARPLDDESLGHVAALDHLRYRRARIGTMFDDAQHAL